MWSWAERTFSPGKVVFFLFVFAGGFLLGFSRRKPPQVITDVKTEIRYVEKLVEVEKEKLVEVKGEEKTRVVFRDRFIAVDGSIRETEVEREESVKTEVREVEKVVEKIVTKEVEKRIHERIEIRPQLPQWHVGLMADAPLQLAWPVAENVGARLVGGHRIIGPLFLDLGLSVQQSEVGFQPRLGVGLSAEF